MRLLLLSLFFALGTQALSFNDNVYERVKYMTNFAKVAYCSVESYFTTGDIENACPKVEFCENSKDTDIIGVFKPDISQLELSGDAYVAVDHSKNEVYVVFRGSFSVGDWITDFLFGYCPYAPILENPQINSTLFDDVNKETSTDDVAQRIEENADDIPCQDCYVHCGVYVALSQFIQELHDTAKPYLDQNYQLYITGHSLGGGYAGLAGFEFLYAGYKPIVISYSSLRVGNPAYNNYVDKKFNTKSNAEVVANGGDLPVPSFSRVYQQTDIVPRLPPGPGYTHAGLQFELTKLRLPHSKDNVVYLGASDNYENSDYSLITNDPLSLLIVYQHIYLFQRISWPCNDLLTKRDHYADIFKREFNEEQYEEYSKMFLRGYQIN